MDIAVCLFSGEAERAVSMLYADLSVNRNMWSHSITQLPEITVLRG